MHRTGSNYLDLDFLEGVFMKVYREGIMNTKRCSDNFCSKSKKTLTIH